MLIAAAVFLVPAGLDASTLDDLYQQQQDAQSAADAARKKAAQKEYEAQEIEDQIYYINLQISDSQKAINETDAKIKETEAKIAELRDRKEPVNERVIEGIKISSSILKFDKEQTKVIEKAEQAQFAREEDIQKLESERARLAKKLKDLE